ncbi:hypothetical protein AWM79_07870 [Pseudomonas agarici]|uniref:Uncharacterized protein n=1 Tax=Pseudomonas agarici TaxID=46677 RepID=A0A0X1SZJ1_PSEAA|nr:hypothetical protein AWM79_07870 [Pseudomonas agarici]
MNQRLDSMLQEMSSKGFPTFTPDNKKMPNMRFQLFHFDFLEKWHDNFWIANVVQIYLSNLAAMICLLIQIF